MRPRFREVKTDTYALSANSEQDELVCETCGHLWTRHASGGMCAGARFGGSECDCVLFPPEVSPSVSKATPPNSSKSVLAWDTVGAGTGTLGEASSRKDRLGLLHVALKDLAAEIDDAPERYETTGKGSLADMDAEVLRLATSVVHRLLQWEMFPLNSPESYFKP